MTSTSYYHREKKDPIDISHHITIGTGFDIHRDGALKRNKPIAVEEMTVRDTEGRRRFHGAFTGGFSAGYFNTCNTEEGWIPSNFVSSKNQKSVGTQLKPEDFMDDEDLAEYGIAPRGVKTKEEYTTKAVNISFHNAKSLQELLSAQSKSNRIIHNSNIGFTLLKNIGWKEGRGVGELVTVESNKRVYGCALPPELQKPKNQILPHDLQIKKPQIWDSFNGIGYIPMRTLLGTEGNEGSNLRPTGKEKAGIKGEAFGQGVLDDDDDYLYDVNIFQDDDIHNYDFTMRKDSEQVNATINTDKLDFKKSSAKGSSLLSLYNNILPKLPEKFHPAPKLGPAIKHSSQNSSAKLSISQKSEILGETDTQKKKIIIENTEKVISSVAVNLPFKLKQFSKASESEIQSLEIKISPRTIKKWFPDRVLCKYFNVPYHSDNTEKPNYRNDRRKDNVNTRITVNKYKVNETIQVESVRTPEVVESETKKKPSLDLFKSIFCDD